MAILATEKQTRDPQTSWKVCVQTAHPHRPHAWSLCRVVSGLVYLVSVNECGQHCKWLLVSLGILYLLYDLGKLDCVP